MYARLGLKFTYFIAFTLALFGGLGILYIEYTNLKGHGQTHGAENYYIYRMPALIFLAKFGVAIGYLCSYYASFSDNRIFPIERRTTAIGFCKFIGRAVTGLAPIINEIAEPFPMVCFTSILGFAFLYNLTFNLPGL